MLGDKSNQVEALIALTPDELVPQDHPIRQIKPIVEKAVMFYPFSLHSLGRTF